MPAGQWHRRIRALVLLVACAFVAAACTTAAPGRTGAAQTGAAQTGAAQTGAAQTEADAAALRDPLVLLISVDGFTPQALKALGPARTPTMHSMMREGVSTLNARTIYEGTKTLPNHISMITGRPVTGTRGHKVKFNDDNGQTVHSIAGRYIASAFDVASDAGVDTALYAGKTKFDFLDRSYDEEHGAVDVIGADDGRDKIDVYSRASTTENAAAIVSAIRGGLTGLAFIHFADPDRAGHDKGFMSDGYLDAVARVDAEIGNIREAITDVPQIAERTVVLITSDHGGSASSHGDEKLEANYTVPFIAWGAGVAEGHDAYGLNPDRRDPRHGRPDYDEPVQPIRNSEVGNLALDILGLPPVPGSVANADQSLDLAEATPASP